MWKPSFPSKRLAKHSSSRSLCCSETTNAPSCNPSRDETKFSLCKSENETVSFRTRRSSLRRLSLTSVSRPQWGKRLQRRMSFRMPKLMSKEDGCDSLSLTNPSDEDASIKSTLSTACCSSAPSSPSIGLKMHPRFVRFSVVQIREFARTVGENPACKAGPPLTLDWSYVEQPEEWLFDTHDNDVISQGKSKRTIQELFVSAERRIELLRDDWGITESELAAAMHAVDEIKKSRQQVVVEFRRLLAVKRQEQEQAAQASDASAVDFPITRLEC
ncbi:hypothetical protein FisN_8Lh378 [Fistulifera solaris]|uniref:Uncharacterized protein n=1 Tax=Fistulifera solaris TaxID=1519565 RepID=A0A1Z5JMX2_FISSO|nr:hypothetical protein FisN_8Lh378 [Fistulifera solaris]|eukprot:GAX15329.1 hypothetical protein FisN_8Lh378 [Fistulifera solaris]